MNVERETEFDIVAWGATGFIGRLAAEKLAARIGGRDDLRWAIGGRNQAKLEFAGRLMLTPCRVRRLSIRQPRVELHHPQRDSTRVDRLKVPVRTSVQHWRRHSHEPTCEKRHLPTKQDKAPETTSRPGETWGVRTSQWAQKDSDLSRPATSRRTRRLPRSSGRDMAARDGTLILWTQKDSLLGCCAIWTVARRQHTDHSPRRAISNARIRAGPAICASNPLSGRTPRHRPGRPWHCLYLRPKPHRQRWFRPTLVPTSAG